MMTSNNALIPDPDKEDILASNPSDWPLMRLGLRMCGWGDNQPKYYLLGTPIIWWGSTLSLVLGLAALGVYVLRQQRRYVDMEPSTYMTSYSMSVSLILQLCHRRVGSFPIRRKNRFVRLDFALR